MQICEEAWSRFLVLSRAIYYGSPEYNKPTPDRSKLRGNTIIGNKEADFFDVFNFWREEFLGGQVYSSQYLSKIDAIALKEEHKQERVRGTKHRKTS